MDFCQNVLKLPSELTYFLEIKRQGSEQLLFWEDGEINTMIFRKIWRWILNHKNMASEHTKFSVLYSYPK